RNNLPSQAVTLFFGNIKLPNALPNQPDSNPVMNASKVVTANINPFESLSSSPVFEIRFESSCMLIYNAIPSHANPKAIAPANAPRPPSNLKDPATNIT